MENQKHEEPKEVVEAQKAVAKAACLPKAKRDEIKAALQGYVAGRESEVDEMRRAGHADWVTASLRLDTLKQTIDDLESVPPCEEPKEEPKEGKEEAKPEASKEPEEKAT